MDWVGLHYDADLLYGILASQGQITSLNLPNIPIRLITVIITSRKPMPREVKRLAQGHTVSGRARIPQQVYLMLETRLSPPSAPLIKPSSSFLPGS